MDILTVRHKMPPGRDDGQRTIGSNKGDCGQTTEKTHPHRRGEEADCGRDDGQRGPRWRGWLRLMVFISVRSMIGARNIVRGSSGQSGSAAVAADRYVFFT